MFGVSMAATFQYIEEADEIGIGVGMGIGQRVTHARLRREVNHEGKAMCDKQSGHRFAVGNVQLLELEARKCCELCNAGSF